MAGKVTISIEIELGWGHHDLRDDIHPALSEGRQKESKALSRLLKLCDEVDIPCTFPVVGHLFHDSCEGTHSGPHDSKWFSSDPGTDMETDPHFYAPDLIHRICRTDVDHEIATHSYSHILCDEVSDDVLKWELNHVQELHEMADINPAESFVAPRHRPVSGSLLKENGINVRRRPYPGYTQLRGKLQTFLWMLLRSHPQGSLEAAEGLIDTYCTPYPSLTATHLPIGQQYPHAAFRVIPIRVRQALHADYLRSAIDEAVEKERHLHLWTHLYNMSNEVHWPLVSDALSYLGEKQLSEDITMSSMAELSSEGGEFR